jgi:ubiquinone biosynthesis protein UbiJ
MTYVLRIVTGQLTVARGELKDCDAVITAEPTMLAAVVYGGLPLETVEVQGDAELVRRFVDLFELPPKAE